MRAGLLISLVVATTVGAQTHVFDSFTAPNGVLLTQRQPDVGPPWTAACLNVAGNSAAATTMGQWCEARIPVSLPSAFSVSARVRWSGSGGTAALVAGASTIDPSRSVVSIDATGWVNLEQVDPAGRLANLGANSVLLMGDNDLVFVWTPTRRYVVLNGELLDSMPPRASTGSGIGFKLRSTVAGDVVIDDFRISSQYLLSDGGFSLVAPWDAGLPGGAIDAGAVDAGAIDAGAIDAGDIDAGDIDAGAIDTGAMDAGASDAGAIGAGAIDAGAIDAGAIDAGVIDAGFTDTGTVDAGASLANDDADGVDATGHRTYRVGAGCQSAWASVPTFVLALALLGRRRARKVDAQTRQLRA